jgi:hypothetical protein
MEGADFATTFCSGGNTAWRQPTLVSAAATIRPEQQWRIE